MNKLFNMTSLKDSPKPVHLNPSKNSMLSIMKCLGTDLLKFKGKKGSLVWIGPKKRKNKKERMNPNTKSHIKLTKNSPNPTKKIIEILSIREITKETDIQQIVMKDTYKKGMINRKENILLTKNLKSQNITESIRDQLPIQGHPLLQVPNQKEAEQEIKRGIIDMKIESKESHTEKKLSMIKKTKE